MSRNDDLSLERARQTPLHGVPGNGPLANERAAVDRAGRGVGSGVVLLPCNDSWPGTMYTPAFDLKLPTVFADPEHGIGFAYVCNKIGKGPFNDLRERPLFDATYACLESGAS